MKAFRKESELLAPVSGHLRRRGYSRQHEELQFYDHSIDLYGLSIRDNTTTAIELKLYRWTRAVQQAMLYQLCADFVYIALPTATIANVSLPALKEHGIGLIAVAPTRCSIVLPAKRSGFVLDRYRDFYRGLLEKGTAA